MVKAISVYKYEYAPTKAEIRNKIGTRKKIYRQIDEMYQNNNVKKLEQIETIICGLDEHNEDGTLGTIDHQYFRRLDLAGDEHTYEDTWEEFFFFVSSKYNVIIIGGGPERVRLQALWVLVECLSNDIKYLTRITIKTDKMIGLVNKIKTEGPQENREYKNIMTDAYWKFLDKDTHHGAKKEVNNMHRDEADRRCVSKYPTFEENLRDSDSFDPIMLIFRCNGILHTTSSTGNYLKIYDNARFLCTSDPPPHQWIIFVIQTCKTALGLKVNNPT